jgi:hypothetical protein
MLIGAVGRMIGEGGKVIGMAEIGTLIEEEAATHGAIGLVSSIKASKSCAGDKGITCGTLLYCTLWKWL